MKSTRRLVASALAFGFSMTLYGCSTDTIDPQPLPGFIPNPAGPVTAGLVAPKFDPTAGDPSQIPLPNDLLRDPATGLINRFPDTPAFQAEPFASLRTMRGFSTTGNIIIPFDGRIDAGTVNSQTVQIVEDATNTTVPVNLTVTNPEGGAGTGNSTIIAEPIRPLKPFPAQYFVVVTNGIRAGGRGIAAPRVGVATRQTTPLVDANGNTLIFPVSNAQAQALEPLRQFYQPLWARAESITGQPRTDIPFVFRFGTQPLYAALVQARATVQTDARPLLPAITVGVNAFPTQALVDAFYTSAFPNPATRPPHSNIHRLYIGGIQTRNYITNPTTGFFQGTGFPGDPLVPQGDKVKGYIAAFPNPVAFPGPRPAIIFQHGITRSKEDVLALADTLTSAGFGVIAIDLVLHGDPARGGDSLPGQTSGTGFVNLASLRTARDNIRQSAINLFYVSNAIRFGLSDVDGVGGPDFIPEPPGFLGMSLGGIVGGVYTAVDPFSRTAVLNVAGGRITKLLLNSASISPSILSGLAAQGITPGTTNFTNFFLIAQTVVDDADPMNYARPSLTGELKGGAANASRVLLQEAVGDQTVPNVSTDDLANAFEDGFSQVEPFVYRLPLLPLVPAPFAGSGLFQFPNASHGFLLDPTQGNTAAVRAQAVNYLATGRAGTPVIINPFLLFPNPRVLWEYPVNFDFSTLIYNGQ